MVALRLVMKRNRELNESLHMPAQFPLTGFVARHGTPEVFHGLMRREEMTAIEQAEATMEVLVHRSTLHGWLAELSLFSPLESTSFHILIDDRNPENRMDL